MAAANSIGKEEEVRDLHRMLRVFACKQDYSIEENDGGEPAASPDWTVDETEEAFGHTMKGR